MSEVYLLCASQAFEVEQSPNGVLSDDIFVCRVCVRLGQKGRQDPAFPVQENAGLRMARQLL